MQQLFPPPKASVSVGQHCCGQHPGPVQRQQLSPIASEAKRGLHVAAGAIMVLEPIALCSSRRWVAAVTKGCAGPAEADMDCLSAVAVCCCCCQVHIRHYRQVSRVRAAEGGRWVWASIFQVHLNQASAHTLM